MNQLLDRIHQLKTKLDEFKPFHQSQLRNLRQRFRIGFTQNSNAIEGNTLTLSEVKVLLEDGITIGGKTIKELRETLNHGQVLDELVDLFDRERSVTIDQEFVLNMHRVLMDQTIEDDQCGRRRTINVWISNSSDTFPPPSQIDTLMQTFLATRCQSIQTLEDVARIHYDFVKIHPFADGNGRIARLLMNIALVKLGYFPIVIPVVLRTEYIDSLQGDRFEIWYEFLLWQIYENHKDYVRFFTTE